MKDPRNSLVLLIADPSVSQERVYTIHPGQCCTRRVGRDVTATPKTEILPALSNGRQIGLGNTLCNANARTTLVCGLADGRTSDCAAKLGNKLRAFRKSIDTHCASSRLVRFAPVAARRAEASAAVSQVTLVPGELTRGRTSHFNPVPQVVAMNFPVHVTRPLILL